MSQKKSDSLSSVSHKKIYLGFEIDSKLMQVKAREDKILTAEKAIDNITKHKHRKVKVKDMAAMVGKAIALQPATGPVVQLLTRSAQIDIADTVESFGWSGWLIVSEETRNSLMELRDSLREFNGSIIKSAETATPLRVILDDCDSEAVVHGWEDLHRKKVVAGDASNKAVCAYGVEGIPDLYIQAALSEEEGKLSSGHRELLTVKVTLEKKKNLLKSLQSSTFLWLTDSTNMVSFLTKGSTKRHILPVIMDVFRAARDLQIRILPVHISREDYRIQAADEGTRYFDPDDWGVDIPSFQCLTQDKMPTVDLFAHYSNRKVEKFYSYGKAPHSSGTDAMAQCWDQEVAWLCPPTAMVIESFKKACHSTMEAFVVVPAWPSATFWSFLFPDGRRAHEACKYVKVFQPFILRGQHCQNRLLQGRTDFPFLLMFIKTDGSGYRFRSGKCKNPMFTQ